MRERIFRIDFNPGVLKEGHKGPNDLKVLVNAFQE